MLVTEKGPREARRRVRVRSRRRDRVLPRRRPRTAMSRDNTSGPVGVSLAGCSLGGVRERPNRHDWKSCVGQPTVGSNPTSSAPCHGSSARDPEPASRAGLRSARRPLGPRDHDHRAHGVASLPPTQPSASLKDVSTRVADLRTARDRWSTRPGRRRLADGRLLSDRFSPGAGPSHTGGSPAPTIPP